MSPSAPPPAGAASPTQPWHNPPASTRPQHSKPVIFNYLRLLKQIPSHKPPKGYVDFGYDQDADTLVLVDDQGQAVPLGLGTPSLGAALWGSITGTLSSQIDLTSALALKAPLASPTFTGALTVPQAITGTLLSGDQTWKIELATTGVTMIPANGSGASVGVNASGGIIRGTVVVGAMGSDYTAEIQSTFTENCLLAWPNSNGTLALTSEIKAPGGSSGDVQYNNAGAFGGVSGMTLNIGVLQTIAVSLNVLGSSTGIFNLRSANSSSGGLGLGSLNLLAWGSSTAFGTSTISGGGDTILGRQALANVRQGAVDAAAPVAQTSSVQSVATGTSNTAGANRTYSASRGTGTGAGGKHIFQVATAGTTGSSQNTLVTALEIREDRSAFIANVSAAPATPTGGGLLYVEAGALKYIGSSGTITTLGAA